ncbi:MAG: aminotransferase class V-fold PLP-dependent enzyme [Clostridiales bacterium]|nr:aminotransferase class V-fold PLP-dependent enzyme [Clostridiales bacterium]
MIFLKNDYSLGAHPKVLDALVKTNMTLADGYGEDAFCYSAADYIRHLIACPAADIHFLTGGTQTNMTALAAFLRPHHSIISADTGHICVHETGAIEATGHKINHVKTREGKLSPQDIDDVMISHEDEHYVKPRIIYISNSTETGLIYTKAELLALREACDKHHLLMYIDGARLAMALTAQSNDLIFEDLPKIADAFYIGGTKCGAMFGEALIIVNDSLKEDMRFLVKQRGGLLAKGRLLGVQFDALLKDEAYLQLGAHANAMASKLAEGIKAKGYEFVIPPETNLIFPLFPKELAAELATRVMFETWPYVTDTHQAIRLVTSWGTEENEIKEFLKLI